MQNKILYFKIMKKIYATMLQKQNFIRFYVLI